MHVCLLFGEKKSTLDRRQNLLQAHYDGLKWGVSKDIVIIS